MRFIAKRQGTHACPPPCGLHCSTTKVNQTKPNQTKPNQTKQHQAKPNKHNVLTSSKHERIPPCGYTMQYGQGVQQAAASCPTFSRRSPRRSPNITSHHITSHHITSLHITSHHITSHHITSLHTSQHIKSHHIKSHPTFSRRSPRRSPNESTMIPRSMFIMITWGRRARSHVALACGTHRDDR